jgi:hypothetical protein
MAIRLGVPSVERSVSEFNPHFERSTNDLTDDTHHVHYNKSNYDGKIEFAPPYVVDFLGNLTQM